MMVTRMDVVHPSGIIPYSYILFRNTLLNERKGDRRNWDLPAMGNFATSDFMVHD